MRRVKRAPFEYAILRSGGRHKDFKAQLLSWLDNRDIRSLRAVCRVLYDLVDSKPGRPFRELFVGTAVAGAHEDRAWRRIAKFCYILTITIRKPSIHTIEYEKSSSEESLLRRKYSKLSDVPLYQKGKKVLARPLWSRSSPNEQMHKKKEPRLSIAFDKRSIADHDLQSDAQAYWLSLLAPCHQLRTVILRVHGEAGWPGRTEVEYTLVIIRNALEQSELPKVSEIRFAPIHVMGLIHLRWAGLGVFGFASAPPPVSPSGLTVWQRLQTLDLQITSPFHPTAGDQLSIAQKQMFKKILHDLLRSFTPTLRVLRFVWLGDEGPSPFLLHIRDDDEMGSGAFEPQDPDHDYSTTMSPLQWSKLEELNLGSITHLQQTIDLALQSAPRLRKLQVLGPGYQSDMTESADRRAAWVDVIPLAQSKSVPAQRTRAGGALSVLKVMRRRSEGISIYSQDDDLNFTI